MGTANERLRYNITSSLTGRFVRSISCNTQNRCLIARGRAMWHYGDLLGVESVITMTSHECYVVSNHRSFNCLFNSLCAPTSNKNIKVRIFVRGIHRWPVNSPHEGPVMRKKASIWWRHHVIVALSLELQTLFAIACYNRSGMKGPNGITVDLIVIPV